MPTLTERQHRLLTSLIEIYVRTAEPVPSQALVGRPGLDVSPATVRNELAALEAAGFVEQPHTSAGRIPTELAWRTYVMELQKDVSQQNTQPATATATRLRTAAETGEGQDALKTLAKTLVDIVDEAVIVAFSPRDIYYTGLSNLFRKPEFVDRGEVVAISELMDHLEDTVAELFPTASHQVAVLLGRENPLGQQCGLLIARFQTRHGEGVIATLGPLRQPYRQHLQLLAFARDLASENV